MASSVAFKYRGFRRFGFDPIAAAFMSILTEVDQGSVFDNNQCAYLLNVEFDMREGGNHG